MSEELEARLVAAVADAFAEIPPKLVLEAAGVLAAGRAREAALEAELESARHEMEWESCERGKAERERDAARAELEWESCERNKLRVERDDLKLKLEEMARGRDAAVAKARAFETLRKQYDALVVSANGLVNTLMLRSKRVRELEEQLSAAKPAETGAHACCSCADDLRRESAKAYLQLEAAKDALQDLQHEAGNAVHAISKFLRAQP